MSESLLKKARARRRRALSSLARTLRGVAMTEDRARPPHLTAAFAQRFMARAAA